MKSLFRLPSLIAACTLAAAWTSHAQVYSENFNSATLANVSPAYAGGWFIPQQGPGQWFGNSSEAAISGGELLISSTFGLRGAFLLLDPSWFGSDTDFVLTVDVSGLNLGASGNGAFVRVFTGSGYNLALNTGDSLLMNPQAGTVTALGTATASMVVNDPLTLGAGQTIPFSRASGDSVMIFLGVNATQWPFPTMNVDSVRIDAVPEPSAAFLACGAGALFVFRRKRRLAVIG